MKTNEKIKAMEKEAEFLLVLSESEVKRAEVAKANNNFEEADEAIRNAELIDKRCKKLLDEAHILTVEELSTTLIIGLIIALAEKNKIDY